MADTQKQNAALRGTVLWFDHRRGYGFIKRADEGAALVLFDANGKLVFRAPR